jgi:hypothetical protein
MQAFQYRALFVCLLARKQSVYGANQCKYQISAGITFPHCCMYCDCLSARYASLQHVCGSSDLSYRSLCFSIDNERWRIAKSEEEEYKRAELRSWREEECCVASSIELL